MRIQVGAGGDPSPYELAALAVALDAILAGTATPPGSAESVARGWTLAALREGVGGSIHVAPPVPDREH